MAKRKIYKPWIKLHIRLLDNEDVADLSDSSKWKFIECLLLAGEERNRAIESGIDQEDGFLPTMKRMAHVLKTTQQALQDDLSRLAMAGLMELREYPDGSDRWYITHFIKWQEGTPDAERQRFSRSTRKNEEIRTKERERVIDEQFSSQLSHKIVTESRAPQPIPSMTANLHPAVKAMQDVTTYWPGEVTHDYIIAALGDKPDMALLRRANELWAVNRNKAGNFAGICDWYQELRRDPNWTPQARFKGRQPTAAAPDEENIWTRAIAAIKAGKMPQDATLARAIKAVGWSRLQEANQYTQREVREALIHEYRNAATA